jgi:hypothetical protein
MWGHDGDQAREGAHERCLPGHHPAGAAQPIVSGVPHVLGIETVVRSQRSLVMTCARETRPHLTRFSRVNCCTGHSKVYKSNGLEEPAKLNRSSYRSAWSWRMNKRRARAPGQLTQLDEGETRAT